MRPSSHGVAISRLIRTIVWWLMRWKPTGTTGCGSWMRYSANTSGQRAADQGLLSDEARGRILSPAKEFRCIWKDSQTAPIESKRMVALLIEDVTLAKADKVAIHVRFRGGKTTSLTIDKPRPVALIRKTLPKVVCTVDELLETCTHRQGAGRLNELGYRNWKVQTFTVKKVTVIHMAYRLRSRFERLRGRGMPAEVARAGAGFFHFLVVTTLRTSGARVRPWTTIEKITTA